MSGDKDEPRTVKLVPQYTPSEIETATEQYRKNEVAIGEYYKINARIQRKRYLSLRAEGFTRSQALELCKSI